MQLNRRGSEAVGEQTAQIYSKGDSSAAVLVSTMGVILGIVSVVCISEVVVGVSEKGESSKGAAVSAGLIVIPKSKSKLLCIVEKDIGDDSTCVVLEVCEGGETTPPPEAGEAGAGEMVEAACVGSCGVGPLPGAPVPEFVEGGLEVVEEGPDIFALPEAEAPSSPRGVELALLASAFVGELSLSVPE